MTDPALYIMIATAGKETGLTTTLASLAKCTKPAGYQSTIVIENGSKHRAEAITKKYEAELRTNYFFFPKGNKSAALNFGLESMGNENGLVVFIDDDVRVEESTLVAYEQARQEKHTGYFFGGSLKVNYEATPPDWFRTVLPPSAQGWEPNGNDDYLITPRFLGANWAAFSDDIKRIGGFNVNLGPGTKPRRTGQEWNMQERMLAEGFKAIYVKDAVVWHYVPKEKSSLSWFIVRRFQGGLGAGMWFVEKNGKKKIPMNLIRYFIKSCLLLPIHFLSLSRAKVVIGIGDFSAGLGRIKGYFTAVFSQPA